MSSYEECEPETKKWKSQASEDSKQKYLLAYQQFMDWKSQKGRQDISEQTLLEYFQERSKNNSPTTLWCFYSMLKSVLLEKHNIDMNKFTILKSFIKEKNTGYKPKKTKLLTAENIEQFLNTAPEEVYLAQKVLLILAVYGDCNNKELCELSLRNVQKSNFGLVVNRLDASGADRSIVIRRVDHLKIIDKYLALRPKNMPSDRFFAHYLKGKCTKQFIGINKIKEMPKQIAMFLKLPEPNRYTGRCFKSSSSLVFKNTTAYNKQLESNSSRLHQNDYNMDNSLGSSSSLCQNYNLDNSFYETVAVKTDPGLACEDVIPIEFQESYSETKVDIDNFSNKDAEPNVKDCLENESDIEDNCTLKQIKEELYDPESSHEKYNNFIDNTSKDKFDSSAKTPKAKVTSKVSINQHKHETTITLPNKTVKLVFKNCKNISNIRINL